MPSSWAPSTARDRPATTMRSAGVPYITHCNMHTPCCLVAYGREKRYTTFRNITSSMGMPGNCCSAGLGRSKLVS